MEHVYKRKFLVCGIDGDLGGFSQIEKGAKPDADGLYMTATGFDVDYCKAVAVTIFGDLNDGRVKYRVLDDKNRWEAVIKGGDSPGGVDILFRNTTWTVGRDTALPIEFGPTTFYDGQSFLVKETSGITSIAGLRGADICVSSTTTSFPNLELEFGLGNYTAVTRPGDTQSEFEDNDQVWEHFTTDTSQCEAFTTDRSQLITRWEELEPSSRQKYKLLNEKISREPLGPVFIAGDPIWRDVVNYTVYATIYAEELGIDQAFLLQLQSIGSTDAITGTARREFLGLSSERNIPAEEYIGSQLDGGLNLIKKEFAYNIILYVGNHGNIFERHLGYLKKYEPDDPTGRGPNKPWNKGSGGVLNSPPFVIYGPAYVPTTTLNLVPTPTP